MSRPCQKCNKARQLQNKSLVTDNKDGCYSSWSLSMDEDFIVFCFGEDTNSRPLNPKEEEKECRQQHTESSSSSRRVSEVVESRDSKSSAGSFAFPVLGLEWIGSPVQMPKSEESQHLKKQKARCLRFQCYKF